jgi:hypothetical protein
VITDLHELLQLYSGAGLAAFPLYSVGGDGRCTCGRDCPSPAKHPILGLAHSKDDPRRQTCRGECGQEGHGLHDATTDMGVIAEWLARFPDCNWGIRPSKTVVVVDVDPRNGGDDTLAALLAEHGALPPTLTARTGSGGLHIWLSYSGPARGKLATGIDIKTNTGYVVAPPSRHVAGGTYHWVDMRPAAYAPEWVKALINPPVTIRHYPPGRGGDGKGLIAKVAGTPFGEINDVLYWAACRAVEQGVLDNIFEDLVQAAAHAAGAQASSAGETQTRRTIDSARRAAPRPVATTRKSVVWE